MPKNINSVELQGHLGKDPELKYTEGGSALCKFSMATTDRRKNKQTEEWEDGDTHWHNITVWGSKAEWCAKELSKGDCANVKGKISYRKYNDKYYTDIIGFEVSKVEKDQPKQQTIPDDEIPF